ncbi:MAG: class I SAM-dependent methyltransferase [Mangrovibacterium sp.]
MDQQQFYTSIANYYEHIFPLNIAQPAFVKVEVGELDDRHFLDVGCSTGQLAHALTSKGALGIGIDLNGDMIRRANEQYTSPALNFRLMDMLTIGENFPPAYFDFVCCFGNTLVHLDSVTRVSDFFKQCAGVLKPEGKLLFQILNYQHIIASNIEELPLIENDVIRFERYYRLPGSRHSTIEFRTLLTIKKTGQQLANSTFLLPLRKNDLEPLLLAAGFREIAFYENFKSAPLTGTQLPLVVSAQK